MFGKTLWIAATVAVGLLIPGGGFIVALLSLLRVFKPNRPSIWILIVISMIVLVIQIIGLQSTFSSGWVGPENRA